MDEKVTVVIPVYNSQDYLVDCVESIYAQTYNNIEVIAVDDGSTDDSLNILLSLQQAYPDLIIISQENKGPGGARNTGLRRATGKYIYFIDSDDMVDSSMLEECVPVIENNDCDIVGFQGEIIGNIGDYNKNQYIYSNRCLDMNKIISGNDFLLKYHRRIPLLNIPMLVYKTNYLINNNLFILEDIYYEDSEYYYRVMSCNPKLVLMDRVFYRRRYRESSIMTSVFDRKRLNDTISVDVLIGKMVASDKLVNVFIGDAVSDIYRILKMAQKYDIELGQDNVDLVLEIIHRNEENAFNTSVLVNCWIFLIAQMLTRYSSKKIDIDNCIKRLEQFAKKTQLLNRDKLVGIYGTGGVTDVFISVLEELFHKKMSKLIFIDSYLETGTALYRGNKIFNYADVKYENIESIIISTEFYINDILRNVKTMNDIVPIYAIENCID